ncbi:MAG: hypothetical protein G8D58_03810 [gamma proteobacterium symbiont of Phacoides pectinatus]
MNVFVLNSGRCGSTTFIQACRHIDNFSAGHESRIGRIGPQRLAYPPNHIEADNRLSWLLGRLDRTYGDNARYVHLIREPDATARSFHKRREMGIMRAYREGILLGGEPGQEPLAIAHDYLDTVDSNIRLFLRDKRQCMEFHLENAGADFQRFWSWIGAEGDLAQALAQLEINHNASA